MSGADERRLEPEFLGVWMHGGVYVWLACLVSRRKSDH